MRNDQEGDGWALRYGAHECVTPGAYMPMAINANLGCRVAGNECTWMSMDVMYKVGNAPYPINSDDTTENRTDKNLLKETILHADEKENQDHSNGAKREKTESTHEVAFGGSVNRLKHNASSLTLTLHART